MLLFYFLFFSAIKVLNKYYSWGAQLLMLSLGKILLENIFFQGDTKIIYKEPWLFGYIFPTFAWTLNIFLKVSCYLLTWWVCPLANTWKVPTHISSKPFSKIMTLSPHNIQDHGLLEHTLWNACCDVYTIFM